MNHEDKRIVLPVLLALLVGIVLLCCTGFVLLGALSQASR